MARRYVRDKGGRFASKGGGGKRTGKLSKSTAGRSAKAKYKSASSKARKSERDFKSARKSSSIMSKKASRANWNEKATGKAMVAGDKFARAGRARTSAKGQLTRVTNKMTKKGAAKAKVSPKREKSLAKAKQASSMRKLQKKSKATRTKTAATKKSETKKATAAKKKVAAKAKKPSYKKPKAGETAKQYKSRLKRSGTLSTQRALSGNFGTRSEYYSIPGTKTGGKKTRKSINRAKNRDFYSEGSNKRSRAITKSKQRNKAKVKKQLDAIRRKAKNIKFGEKKGPLTSGLSRGSSFSSSKWK